MRLAWYAAYGSNTDQARFSAYLAGCARPCAPTDSRSLVIDLPLYFAGATSRWGEGGVAFVDIDHDPVPSTLARAWLLPVDRLAEIGAQENRAPLDSARLDLDAVVGMGIDVAFTGWYDAWVHCGDLDDLPVVTLTASSKRSPINPPSRAYAEVVARGLRVTHGMTREAVAEYLTSRANVPVATLLEWQAEGSGYARAND